MNFVIPSEFLDQVHAECDRQGVTIESIVTVLKSAMTGAVICNVKTGEIIADDDKTRVKAAQSLLQLMQIPLATKITTLKRAALEKAPIDLYQIIESKKQQELLESHGEEGTVTQRDH